MWRLLRTIHHSAFESLGEIARDSGMDRAGREYMRDSECLGKQVGDDGFCDVVPGVKVASTGGAADNKEFHNDDIN